jgi:hypothetical protein
MTGRPEALGRLRERFRWNAVWLERPMYAVFQGRIVHDTLPPPAGRRTDAAVSDSATTPRVVRRFFIVRVDTLRSWQPRDCDGARPVPLGTVPR